MWHLRWFQAYKQPEWMYTVTPDLEYFIWNVRSLTEPTAKCLKIESVPSEARTLNEKNGFYQQAMEEENWRSEGDGRSIEITQEPSQWAFVFWKFRWHAMNGGISSPKSSRRHWAMNMKKKIVPALTLFSFSLCLLFVFIRLSELLLPGGYWPDNNSTN